MKTVGDIFKAMGANGDACVLNGIVEKVNINNNSRAVSVQARFDSLIPFEALFNSERALAQALGASVRFFPKYDPSLFTADYFPQLYSAVRREIPSINGTLNNAAVSFENNILTIELQNGGKSLLDAKDFDRLLKKQISEQFGFIPELRYGGTLEIDGQSEDYLQAIKNAETAIQRENDIRTAETFAEEAENSEKIQSAKLEKSAAEVEIREGAFATPQIIQSSVRPLYGRSIRGKMIPISSITDDFSSKKTNLRSAFSSSFSSLESPSSFFFFSFF